MTTQEAIISVEQATSPFMLLGKEDPGKVYKQFAKLLHPDVVTGKLRHRAQDAFTKLGRLYDSINGKVASAPPVVIGGWIVADAVAKGDVCDLYSASHVHKDQGNVIFKIARSEDDRDLMEAESFALKFLAASKEGEAYRKYIPACIESFEAAGRGVNVLSRSHESHTLAEIRTLFPGGFDFRHAVWMVNRTLSSLGFVHRSGLVHGAILPEHLIFGAESHGLTVVDWCYSVTGESQKPIPAIVKARKFCYPKEVLRKEVPTAATDIYMLFASLKFCGIAIPKRFRSLFEWCLASSPRSRPADAWELQDRWVATAREEYGPPSYLKLEIPIS